MAKPSTTKKHKNVENKTYAREIHGLRSSNAAGTHADKCNRRHRTRSAQTRRALADF